MIIADEVNGMPSPSCDLDAIARRYKQFAETQAHGISPLYERLAENIATTDSLLAFLSGLPADRQQPNLFLGAVRHVCGLARDATDFARLVQENGEAIRDIMLSRTTQTNEPARCAVLLPVLAALNQPLALIEVGASAGLCLLPDYYRYDYGHHQITGRNSVAESAPEFPCQANSQTPIPEQTPDITWRAGLDLNPLDVGSDEEVAWLETLVWPEQTARAARLRSAIVIARQNPPRIHRGNLLEDLLRVADAAPSNAQLVIFHTAVLAYVSDQKERDRFADLVRDLKAVWISNEAPTIFPDQASRAQAPPQKGSFLMSVDSKPIAWTGPHGQYIHWFADTEVA